MATVDTIFQGALTVMQGLFGSVDVVYDGIEGTGLKEQVSTDGAATDYGDQGRPVCAVIVSTVTFTTEPKRGATIMCDAKKCTVLSVDSNTATRRIAYQEQAE
jgi:hypothetical protein